ncbi:deoxyribodipyrimidine photo-lyase [Pseudoalteromonas sp. NZS100_1]|uniref:deoxyribodipyrimidine photo-lyase n=1 Tax=Pseudoalteromonas sp. NZS100_1 TaxID=2792073 RepID=UPI0018CD38C6|nr:deoxyribodipyrimidine photo-lyase [Pseudoalteromonas sp. NZS100_1]MBH0011842.1 deoxyribodipyrimidine photo-lyase [Pseudoalteromonas sp. NZS100_1]
MDTLFWFRRDLRLFSNEALIQALNNGAKHAIFFVSEKQWQQHQAAPIQIDLLKRRVAYLQSQLADVGITLHIIEAPSFCDCERELINFCKLNDVKHVIANTEYELNEVNRDKAILHECDELSITFTLYEGDLIAPVGTVKNQSNEMYKVFTPFKRAWLKQYQDTHFSLPQWPLSSEPIKFDESDLLKSDGSSDKWPVDDETLATVVDNFICDKLTSYDDQRDIPSIKGTSGLSPYLALGIVGTKQLLINIQQRYPDILTTSKSKTFTWINELIWREFYRHLIAEFPKLSRGDNFNEKYNAVVWRKNESEFKAWCEGRTGYPLVDAAMLQLKQTGWMHNRLRMVVASFLTKHLLIDWREGERFFMQHLIDGDLASNNGGWQWAASTGCDAQPYFRVFNPIRQSERFDPTGKFIRKYLPELENVPDKHIHFPHTYLAAIGKDKECYWPAIVDHKAARERALAAFKV